MSIVFVEANFSGAQAIANCAVAGIETILLTSSFQRLLKILPRGSEALLGKANHIIEVADSFNVDAMAQSLRASKLKIDAILTFSQPYTVVTAELAAQFGLAHANINSVRLARDKYSMRQRLSQFGVEHVACAIAESRSEIAEKAYAVGFPCVLKPNAGQASIGVFVCRNEVDLERALHAINTSAAMSVSTSYLIEEFLEGPLFSVESLTWLGGDHQFWGLSDRTVIDGATETSSSFPVFPENHDAVIAHVSAALTAIGYDLGAAHTEVILTPKGPRIVEINARVGGSGHLQMLELAMQAPLSLDIVTCHLGEKKIARTPVQGACWHALVPQASGHIISLPTRIEVLAASDVADVWYFRSINEEYKPCHSNFDWVLEILASGRTAGNARATAENNIELALGKTVILPSQTRGMVC